jgi:hypothetical protein
MMCVLSKPDRRDGMSLPPNDINWKALEKSPRKLRIGLMLDAGTGQALEKDVREVAVKAAKAFESAGAVVTEVDGIMTRELLDGLDNFWRARGRSLQPPGSAALPTSAMGEAAPNFRVDVIRFNATMAIRAAPQNCSANSLRDFAGIASREPAELPPDQRSRKYVRAHRLHRRGTCRKILSLDQWRLYERVSDRRPDRRPPLRRSRCARHGQGVRGLRGPQRPWPSRRSNSPSFRGARAKPGSGFPPSPGNLAAIPEGCNNLKNIARGTTPMARTINTGHDQLTIPTGPKAQRLTAP